jgi:hypothetical protein
MSTNYQWKGPLSLSFGYDDGDYHNTEITRGSGDQEVLREIKQCRTILKKGKKAGGFSIGWCDTATDASDSLRFPSIMSTRENALELLKALEDFNQS